MSKYIDAEKLIHDLEERIFAYSEGYAEGDDCRKDAIETLLKDVRYQCSIQQEQPEVNLEKEIESYLDGFIKTPTRTYFRDTIRHFYKLGRTGKEESVGVIESPSKTFPRVNEFDCGSSYRH